MKASEQKKLSLEVKTADESAEVFIIDGRFKMVDRGRGQQNTFNLSPGIYTVKVRAGFESRTENVVLLDKAETVEFDHIHFPSAAPLADTGKTHDYHTDAAAYESRQVRVNRGAGSSIFVFVRDWTSQQRADAGREPNRSPHRGLKLLDAQGGVVADLETECKVDTTRDPWAACNVQLNPGIYRLALELSSGGSIEQTVVASNNWQTQVFLLQRNYGDDDANRCADLISASIMLSRGGFNPDDQLNRLVESARLGLVNTRQVLPEHIVNEILDGKFENPMLGIFGAHLLLLNKQIKLDVLRIVVDNLRGLLGKQHPDVEALALWLGTKETSYIFEQPPMLRRSWWQVVKATIDKAGLVPVDSMAAQCATRIWGEEPWLQWKTEKVREALPEYEVLSATDEEPRVESSPVEAYLIHLDSQVGNAFTLTVDEPSAPSRSSSKRGFAKKGRSSSQSAQGDAQTARDLSAPKARKRKPRTRLNKKELRMIVQSSGLPHANVQVLFNQYREAKAAEAASDTKVESE